MPYQGNMVNVSFEPNFLGSKLIFREFPLYDCPKWGIFVNREVPSISMLKSKDEKSKS